MASVDTVRPDKPSNGASGKTIPYQSGAIAGSDLPPILQTVRLFSRPTGLLRDMYAPGADIARLRLTKTRSLLLTRDPAGVKALFTAPPGSVPSATSESPLKPVMGPHSVLILNGAEHMRQRKLLLPSFHGRRLAAYRPIIEAAAEAEIATWRAGEELAIQSRMQHITLEVILSAVFGADDAARREALRAAIVASLDHTDSVIGAISTVGAGRYGRLFGKAKRLLEAMDRAIYAEIEAHRRRGGLEERDDILSGLMLAHDEDGVGMGDQELRDELVSLLLAGHETTATSLAWSVERLVRTPHAYAQLAAEARGGDGTAYHDAVVYETLRDRPVIPFVGRILTAPLVLGEHLLPAGVVVGADIWSTNHHPAHYADPKAFLPERFLDAKPDTYAWIPFGGGVRRCIGAAFAQLEMQLILQAIFRHADLEALTPETERVRRRNITFVPQHGGRVRVGRLRA